MTEITRYELPPGGISLLGYIVRRMHKTTWLVPIPDLISQGAYIKALEYIAVYTAASSTSYGRAYYQPDFNNTGDSITEPDPATGASITARLNSRSPHYHISYEVVMPGGCNFSGNEEITGTTIGLRGLGMPAPSRFRFTSGAYDADLTGIITSELALSLRGHTRVRAFGFLNFRDNAGHEGHLDLKRNGDLTLRMIDSVVCYSLAELPVPETT